MTIPIPYVVERHGREERAMDIYSRLLKDRIIILGSSINDTVSNSIVAQLLFLQFDDGESDIHMYINSPGGSITSGMAIYDTMQYIGCDVSTYCIGQASSMGAILLAAGTAGKRNSLPNSRIMIHQPLAGMEGTATDLEIHAREVLKVKQRMNEILLSHTGQTLEQIEQDTDRDNFMTAEEAQSYGLIDNVLEHLVHEGATDDDTDDDTGDGDTGDDDDMDFVFADDDPDSYTRIDRIGMPAIATAVIMSKDAYNQADPLDDAAGDFVGEIVASLEAYHGALGDDLTGAGLTPCSTTDEMGVIDISPCVAVAAPLVLPDTLKIDTNAPAGFPNGRGLEDKAVDATLAVVLLDLSVHGVDTLFGLSQGSNDMSFEDDFPYVAPAH